MRFFILLQTVLFALAFAVFGIVAFVRIGSSQQLLASKLQRIQAGTVQPLTLTVVRKYTYTSKSSSPYRHVIYHDPQRAEINILVTAQSFYDAAKPGDKVVGYSFPDGYVIPQSLAPARNADSVRWIFLAGGLGMGAIVFLYSLYRFANPTTPIDRPSIADAIRQRMNQSSNL